MAIHKRHGHYYTDFYVQGERIRKEIPTSLSGGPEAADAESACAVPFVVVPLLKEGE